MTKRTQLDHLHHQILGEIDSLEARLEAVAGQVAGSVTQLQSDRAAAKVDMKAIADKLVAAAKAQQTATTAVALSKDGQAAVVGAVNYVLDQRTPGLVKALGEAEPSALGELKGEIQKLTQTQAAVVQQLQAQQGFDWGRFWPFVAACVVSAAISGLVVAWAVKPASADRQDLTLGSGQKIDAGKQEQR